MTDLRKLSEAAKSARRAYETALMTPNGPWALLKIRQSAAVSEYHNALEAEHRSGSLIPRSEYKRVLALLAEAREALVGCDGGVHDEDCRSQRLSPRACNCGHAEVVATLSRIDDALSAEIGAKS